MVATLYRPYVALRYALLSTPIFIQSHQAETSVLRKATFEIGSDSRIIKYSSASIGWRKSSDSEKKKFRLEIVFLYYYSNHVFPLVV